VTLLGIAVLVFAPMLVEAARAARNERAQRARGGVEPGDDVYPVMRLVYPGAFLAMLGEGALRGNGSGRLLGAGLVIFVAAKAIKWWAILALERSWTFRVIVVPGDSPVVRGPYRYLRHPNYVGVVGELVGAAVMTGAGVAGVTATAAFALLLSKRIAVEERALEKM
jgi:methyltransferase